MNDDVIDNITEETYERVFRICEACGAVAVAVVVDMMRVERGNGRHTLAARCAHRYCPMHARASLLYAADDNLLGAGVPCVSRSA